MLLAEEKDSNCNADLVHKDYILRTANKALLIWLSDFASKPLLKICDESNQNHIKQTLRAHLELRVWVT